MKKIVNIDVTNTVVRVSRKWGETTIEHKVVTNSEGRIIAAPLDQFLAALAIEVDADKSGSSLADKLIEHSAKVIADMKESSRY
jgi:hypothetical protein